MTQNWPKYYHFFSLITCNKSRPDNCQFWSGLWCFHSQVGWLNRNYKHTMTKMLFWNMMMIDSDFPWWIIVGNCIRVIPYTFMVHSLMILTWASNAQLHNGSLHLLNCNILCACTILVYKCNLDFVGPNWVKAKSANAAVFFFDINTSVFLFSPLWYLGFLSHNFVNWRARTSSPSTKAEKELGIWKFLASSVVANL